MQAEIPPISTEDCNSSVAKHPSDEVISNDKLSMGSVEETLKVYFIAAEGFARELEGFNDCETEIFASSDVL